MERSLRDLITSLKLISLSDGVPLPQWSGRHSCCLPDNHLLQLFLHSGARARDRCYEHRLLKGRKKENTVETGSAPTLNQRCMLQR